MKMKLLKPCVVLGHPNARVGEILEVSSNTFQVLEGLGAAEEVNVGQRFVPVSESKQETKVESNEIETRDPQIETRNPSAEPPPPAPAAPRARRSKNA
jgi:hypothetical protein